MGIIRTLHATNPDVEQVNGYVLGSLKERGLDLSIESVYDLQSCMTKLERPKDYDLLVVGSMTIHPFMNGQYDSAVEIVMRGKEVRIPTVVFNNTQPRDDSLLRAFDCYVLESIPKPLDLLEAVSNAIAVKHLNG